VPSTHCKHINADSGVLCERPLAEHDPLRCDVGGAKVRYHNLLRDVIAEWTALHTGAATAREQLVPAWHKAEPPSAEHPEGRTLLARLDVAAWVQGRRTYIDVGFRCASTATEDELLRRAQSDGHAAQDYADAKRRRYPPHLNPGEALVPFIVEALGRPSEEAVSFLRSVAPRDAATRSAALGAIWQRISVITQSRVAELLLSAECPRPT